ncbi:MAG: FecR family protein, partial [Bacteroidota bacterium]
GNESSIVSAEQKALETSRLLWTIIENPAQTARISTPGFKRHFTRWYAAAAVLLLVAAGIGLTLYMKSSGKPVSYAYKNVVPKVRLIESVNTSGQPVNLRLPDGSTIELAAESRIAYPNNFDSAETRDVYLSGEAFFTVTKQPRRPFRVFANEIVTKVLGTSFRIRSFENDSAIKVVVRTGKVSVYSQTTVDNKETASPYTLGGIILTPNQELVYQKDQQKFRRVLMDNPVMVLPAAADKTLLYDDAPLIKVFNQLDNNYGISIVYDNEALKNCTITADLRTVPFYEKLDLMCKAIGAKYEVIDGQVVIQAKGCD